MRVLTVFGTRPEAIKLSPVIRELQSNPSVREVKVCVTGQHRELLDQVLDLFGVTPDHDLDIMTEGQSLSHVTQAAIGKLDEYVRGREFDWLVVQGDTTTCMAASLVGFYHNIRVAHVEAGLRTGDIRQPFPEEANRKMVTALADIHFAPTRWAADNLLKEQVPADRVHVTGNSVIDALLHVAALDCDLSATGFADIGSHAHPVLATCHRRENFAAVPAICDALLELVRRVDSACVYFPVHPNPNVHGPVHERLGGHERIRLLPPLNYVHLVHLLKRCCLVVTDSGGIQEEAPSFGKPVLVLRNKTERPEGVEAGTARLVGTDTEAIVREAARLMTDADAYNEMAGRRNPYGDGKAAARIVDILGRCARD